MIEPDERTSIALLRAGLAGDLDGQEAILGSCDLVALLGVVAGVTVAIGCEAYGSAAALDARLAAWQALPRAGGAGL